jgi:ADP-heptose:LPS heptosyltransferase
MGFWKDYLGYREARKKLLALDLPSTTVVPSVPVAGKSYKILIIAFDALGDFVLSTPAFKVIRESYPGSRIEVICSRRNGDLAHAYGYFDRVHRIQMNGKGSEEDWKQIAELRERNFDFIINLFDEPDEWAVVKILNLIKKQNCFFSLPLHNKGPWQKRILKFQNILKFDESREVIPFAKRILGIMHGLQLPLPPSIRYEFPRLTGVEKIPSSGKLKVLINTAGSQKANTLDKDGIKKLSQILKQYTYADYFIFEDERTNLIKEFLPEIIVLQSESIIAAGGLLEQMDMVITTDTVTAHLATCFDVPVVIMRVNLPFKAAFDPIYGLNEVVVSQTSKLKDLDFDLLNKAFAKMITSVHAKK